MQPFIHKHLPKSSKELLGQEDSIKRLKDFIVNYKIQKKRSALIYGPTGTGKTSSIYAIANELDYEIVEINASDYRNKNQINEKLGSAITQMSLFAKQKIILIDEADGLSGVKDRGGLQAIIKLAQESKFPIVLTLTDPFQNKFSSLRSKSNMIEFQELDHQSITNILRKISEKEKITYEDEALKSLARRVGGDARAAINDLQTLSNETKKITKKELQDLGDRSKTENIMHALNKIFKTTDPTVAITAFENVTEDINDQFLWIDENLPKEYTNPKDLAAAYDKLSKADVFSRRIRRWQHWRFLVYINALITAGIATSKDEKYKKLVPYKPTGRILKMWWAKQKSMKKKAIAQKIAEKTHSSTKEIIKSTMPYFPAMFKNNEMKNKLIEDLDLNDDEVAWVEKQVKTLSI